MRVFTLLGLLLVATRPTRSVTTEIGHGWAEPLGSAQANAATRIASSTISETMHDETQELHDLVFEYSIWESTWQQDNSFLESDFFNINRLDKVDERSSMNEWHSSAGSKISASHFDVDSQHLSQECETIDCLDPNRIPVDSKNLSSKDFLDNLVPDNRNAHQFGDSFSRTLADCKPTTNPNRDASRISIDGQQSIESVEGNTFDCRIVNTINLKTEAVEVRETFVPDGSPGHTHKIVHFRNYKYLLGLRMLCPHLNWDMDEVKDYDSLCVFLGKETNPEQVEVHGSFAKTHHMMELLLRGKSGRDNVEVGQNNRDVPESSLIAKATSTLQKLIHISNFVLKLFSCRKSGCIISPKVLACFKRICIPVLQCLVKCCRKDMHLFQTRWGTRFKHRHFGLKYCPGRRSNQHTCGFQMTKIVENPDIREHHSVLKDLRARIHAGSTSTTTQKQLNLCWIFNETYRSTATVVRKSHRAFYIQCPRPIWGCFVHHCDQNTNEWIQKWGPQFAHEEFGMRQCQGLEFIQCGLIEPPFDIPARRFLRGKSTRDLLPALSEILQQYDQFVISETASRMFTHTALAILIRTCCRPIINCLHRHCAGNVEEFVRRWGKSVAYSKFSSDCCPGTGSKDSDICQYDSCSSQGYMMDDPPMLQQTR